RAAHFGIGQQEFAQLGMPEGGFGRYRLFRERIGRRIGVSVERRLVEAVTARPESRADFLVAIGFARHDVRQVWNAAGMDRRRAAREACNGKVEAAPEQLARRGLAAIERAERVEAPVGA